MAVGTWIVLLTAIVLSYFIVGVDIGLGLTLIGGILIIFALSLYLIVLFRFGFLTFVVGINIQNLLGAIPLTLDLSAWDAGGSLLALGIVVALAVYGFYVSLAGQLFRDELLPATDRHTSAQ